MKTKTDKRVEAILRQLAYLDERNKLDHPDASIINTFAKLDQNDQRKITKEYPGANWLQRISADHW